MSTEYTKTNWQDGDIITADKMNNIENGVKGIEEDITTVKDGLTAVESDVTDLKEELEQITGISDDVKDALLQIASKVAYIDDDGQDYYDALYNALYPLADLVSISAVYTQSGNVYEGTNLDDLEADLVVTANYSDSSTQTITDYTLSGTLAEGTSTITVSYGGKTTTFTVEVSAATVLYPLPNGIYTDGTFPNKCTMSNDNHVKLEFITAVSGELFVDFKNEIYGSEPSILNNNPVWFTVPASPATFYIENVINESNIQFEMNLRKANASTSLGFGSGRGTHAEGFEITTTLSSESDAASIFIYIPNGIPANTVIEFDVGFRVGTTEYISSGNYPLANEAFNISSINYDAILTITNGNHIKYSAARGSYGHRFVNLTNGIMSNDQTIINDQTKWFTIPSGKLGILEFKNITNDGIDFASNFKIANSSTSSSFAISESAHTEDVTAQAELLADQDVGCLFLYVGTLTGGYEFEFDVSFTVGGIRYI